MDHPPLEEEYDAVSVISIVIATVCVILSIRFLFVGGAKEAGGVGVEAVEVASAIPTRAGSRPSSAAVAATGPPRYDPSVDLATTRCEDLFEWTAGDVIGTGASCAVYRCRLRPGAVHPFASLPDSLAVKVYKTSDITHTVTPEDASLIDREMTALSTYRHPRIIRVVHTFKERDGSRRYYREHEYDSVFVVLEKAPDVAPGPLLASMSGHDRRRLWIDQSGPSELYFYYITRPFLNERQVAFVLFQLLVGVAFLHSKNVIHRDLKPENILVVGEVESSAGTVPSCKLADFGLARDGAAASTLKTVVGTPTYIPPEAFAHFDTGRARYDASFDVYSLGAIFFNIVTKDYPFAHLDLRGIAREKLEGRMRTSLLDGRISDAGRSLLLRMMKLTPSERPTAAAALADPWFEPVRAEAAALFPVPVSV